jgi:hypothetical protein
VAIADLAEWFEDDERGLCPECGDRTLVGAKEAPLFRVCLGCASVWVGGERIDRERRIGVRATDQFDRS